MEFFASLTSPATEQDLHQQLQIETLVRFCASIYEVVSCAEDRGEISMLWGLFEVRRELIRGGVRFSLPGCLNAVTWTVTTGPDNSPEEVTVHCTINRRQHDADFIESLEDFTQDWRKGLIEHLQTDIAVRK